jgi:pimeloyl-ACP methyl ester carboxylesterase
MNFHPAVLKNYLLILNFSSVLLLSGFQELQAQQKTTAKKDIVVLLHGLGRGKSIMEPLQKRLEEAGFSVTNIGYKTIDRTPEQIMNDVSVQINAIRVDSNQTIHFAGHSLGGLVIRAYLDSNRVKNLGRVVLIGSPNKGTPFVDYFRDAWWLKLVGPAAASLGTDTKSFPRSLRPPYYPVGIIAGISKIFNNDDFIPGEDDGIVPVESTKVEGMKDFILLEVSHSSLPRNEIVAQQVIEFLKNGKFLKEVQKQK